jgi:metal-responsive CopG/Arc/MetJ family transcriptional regulator
MRVVSFKIKDEELMLINRIAKKYHMSRSELIRAALKNLMRMIDEYERRGVEPKTVMRKIKEIRVDDDYIEIKVWRRPLKRE